MKLSTSFGFLVISSIFMIVGCTGAPRPQIASSYSSTPAAEISAPGQLYVPTLTAPPANPIKFQDVTAAAGLSYSGASRGASWGDFNGDSWPDVWTSNHFQAFGLYLNQTDGTFTNVITDVMSVTRGGDTHGAAWADFDNDGDQDLAQQAGAQRGVGQGPSQLYINNNGTLTDQAARFGVADPSGRGRTPLWLDWNNDGRLDLLFTNGERSDGQAPSILFEQNDGAFLPVMELPKTARFAQLAGLSGNDTMDLMVYPHGIYNQALVSWNGWKDLANALLPERVEGVNDIAIADFNNDLHPDIFLARSTTGATDIFQPDDNHIKARLSGRKDQKGFSFQAADDLSVRMFAPNQLSLEVFIGSEGKPLPKEFSSEETLFTLSSRDPAVAGIKTDAPNADGGVYIGYNPAAQSWHVLISSRIQYEVNFAIESPVPITNLTTTGFEPVTPSIPARLLIYDQGQYKHQASAGFDISTFCGASAVAGDFDNDMDVDIYLVCTRLTANLPNMLYENRGDGTFVAVPEAGGAAGTLSGVGDSATIVDYDRDGFLDLFVTNGPMRFYWGPNQLFRNQGNKNHWLEVDLEGVVSKWGWDWGQDSGYGWRCHPTPGTRRGDAHLGSKSPAHSFWIG